MEVGHELIVITWLHQAARGAQNHPRSDPSRPLTGVFYTRSPARPNPLGLHPVTVREIDGTRVKIGPIESFDGTPVVDISLLPPALTHDLRDAPGPTYSLASAGRSLLNMSAAHFHFPSACFLKTSRYLPWSFLGCSRTSLICIS